MQQAAGSSSFKEIRVPALLTFMALVLGFVVGSVFRGAAGFDLIGEAAADVGPLWLKALHATLLPRVIGLVVSGISQILGVAGGGGM